MVSVPALFRVPVLWLAKVWALVKVPVLRLVRVPALFRMPVLWLARV